MSLGTQVLQREGPGSLIAGLDAVRARTEISERAGPAAPVITVGSDRATQSNGIADWRSLVDALRRIPELRKIRKF
ncbi:MAG: hypothetical protein WCC65_16910 [Pseudonocardiaceae bacterium]